MNIIKCFDSFGLNGLTEKFRQMYPSSKYTDKYMLNHEKYIVIKRNKNSSNILFLGKYGKFYNNIWDAYFFSENLIDRLNNEFDNTTDDSVMIVELTETQNKDIRTIKHMYCRGFINE